MYDLIHTNLLLIIDTIASILTIMVPIELSVIILIILLILKLINMEVSYLKNNGKSMGCSDAGSDIRLLEVDESIMI